MAFGDRFLTQCPVCRAIGVVTRVVSTAFLCVGVHLILSGHRAADGPLGLSCTALRWTSGCSVGARFQFPGQRPASGIAGLCGEASDILHSVGTVSVALM